jgi:phosphoribosyl 1,2-cyclic phosphodiesterase
MNIRSSVAAMCAVAATTVTVHAQNGKALAALAQDPACQTPTIAAAGGHMPKGQNTVVLRYLGVSNYELAYRDQVLLFDTFYSRVWPARPLGVLPRDFTRANAIFFGHAHWDHIADAPDVAKQTNAKLYGGPPTTEWLKMQGVPDAQFVTWKGGETRTMRAAVRKPSIVDTFKPRVVLPSHHEDETGIGAHYDMPIYPLGIAVREKFPDAQTIDPPYLTALCFDT